MMRGLYKSTGYWQTQAAKSDWVAMVDFAKQNGLGEQAEKLAPKENWGWRRIDKQIGKLRTILLQAGLMVPTLPSAGQ